VRIHTLAMKAKMFELLGIGAGDAQVKFGFLLEALCHDAPSCGGIAFGIDRIAALLFGTDSIRGVIAFPKTTAARALFEGAPSPVAERDLAALSLAVVIKENS
jgi:aspartyl-tRNA synthetase